MTFTQSSEKPLSSSFDMDEDELRQILDQHRLWLQSSGKEGRRADLQGASLNGLNLQGRDLTDANFQHAELRRADFRGAALRRTNLRETDLQNADLESADFLLTSQLAGADVAGAKLPAAIAEFKALGTIAEATANAQKLFIAMLGGCLYSWLTIGTTKDGALLTNSASSPLPILGTAIPIVGFYLIAPVVLIALYFYFHLNMQRLWESLADLPAVFPDGRPLDKMADPWLINGLVRAHFRRLRQQRPALSRMQQWLSIILVWWVVPVTLMVFWGRFLRRHDWLGSSLHIGLIAASLGFGWMSYRLARATIRGLPRTSFSWANGWKDIRTYKRAGGMVAVCIVAYFFYWWTHEAIDSFMNEFDYSKPPQKFAPHFLRQIGFRPFIDIREEEISTKLSSWSPIYSRKAEEIASVKGARLRYADMKSAYALEAFMVNADLNGADLRNAILSEANLAHADLRNANLSLASLVEADLMESNLYGADLTQANLMGADLSKADLAEALLVRVVLYKAVLKAAKLTHADFVGAKLSGANLEEADLSRAELTGTDFENVNLRHTNLRGVDLRSATSLTRHQIAEAATDERTLLPDNLPP